MKRSDGTITRVDTFAFVPSGLRRARPCGVVSALPDQMAAADTAAGGSRRAGARRRLPGRPARRVRPDRRTAPPLGLSAVLSLRRQPRRRQRSVAGCVSCARSAGCGRFRGQSSLATWLYRIGVNVCLNRVSAKTTLGKLTEPIDDRQYVDAGAESRVRPAAARTSAAPRVRAAIAQLPRDAARDADPADVSRDVAPGNRRRARQLGRRGEGEFLSRARAT